jgi:oxygen-independent coproporphyrinogen III oxidase
MLSLYIHIPFCKTKCPYCSFQVCPVDQIKSDIFDAEIKKYVDSVISEIKNYSNILTDKEIKSIYFG